MFTNNVLNLNFLKFSPSSFTKITTTPTVNGSMALDVLDNCNV